MKTIVQNIESLIEDKGLKKKTVASKAGYSKQQFSNLINGRKIIKPDDIVRIANALGVTPNDLFGITTEQSA
jgi:transcriptional regulator with XRE-family HTH domain